MKNFSLTDKFFSNQTEAAPLAVFRISFGILLVISIIRFWANGWIEKLYLQPTFAFSYYGFEWVKPLGNYTYLLFLICAISAILVTIGYKYRWAIISLFLSFTYIELMDKTTYLNHYYFISLVSFLLIFLPANAYFSVDAFRNEKKRFQKVPIWTSNVLKLMLFIVYFYAGLAKLNSDWLIEAMPLKIWLPSKYSLPILGDLFQMSWTHYAFSWAGALYDLSIPFLLYYKRTRILAFGLVVVFHVLTRVLFPIGMFPYVMIASALIFFDAGVHRRILSFLSRIWLCVHKFWTSSFHPLSPPPAGDSLREGKLQAKGFPPLAWGGTDSQMINRIFDNGKAYQLTQAFRKKATLVILVIFFLIQFVLPFRYLLYPGELFWTEEGYRFSWRVMLMEKAGYASFKIVDPDTGKRFYVNNSDFLTSFQEKQMATQADFIIAYAHSLEKHFKHTGIKNPEVYVESYVALNGRRSQAYIDPEQDLTKVQDSFRHKNWILTFTDEIKGL